MTKIEFLKKLFKTEDVTCGDCGQMYWVNKNLVWVDNLKGGRISVKIKPWSNCQVAYVNAKKLWNNLMEMNYPVDAATKVDVYVCRTQGMYDGYEGFAIRLRCDKPC